MDTEPEDILCPECGGVIDVKILDDDDDEKGTTNTSVKLSVI